MSDKAVPSALGATFAIAEVTLRRLLRSRAIWVGLAISAIPVLFAAGTRGKLGVSVGEDLFTFEELVLAVIAPMFVASSIGEEIEDRTLTYLWSRPVPRWSVLAGKLCALAPLVLAIVFTSWTVAVLVSVNAPPPVQSYVALAVGTLAVSAVATGLAAVSPRHGMAFSIVFMLFFDIPVGLLPATVAKLSVTYQMRTLSGFFPAQHDLLGAVVAMLVIGVAWGALAAWRIRRLEA